MINTGARSAEAANLFDLDAEKDRESQVPVPAPTSVEQIKDQTQPKEANRKVKITFDEYRKYAIMITGEIKQMERSGVDSVSQSDVVNRLVQKLELEDGIDQGQQTLEASLQLTKKLQNVIQHLIVKENILMIT
jgi:hypothetical protein